MRRILKLIKMGTSIGIVIRKEDLEKLGKTAGDYVEIVIKEDKENGK